MDSSSSATRIVPCGGAGLSGGVADISLTHRQAHPESGAAPWTRLVRDRPAVFGDDAVAEGESEPAAAGPGREEGREELRHVVRGDAGSRVLDDDQQELTPAPAAPDVVAGLDAGRDPELAPAAERLERVL